MSYIKHKSEESMEDYLETILHLYKKNGHVRSIDIANELAFTKATLTKREADDKSPGSPIAPMPRLYFSKDILSQKQFFGSFVDRFI